MIERRFSKNGFYVDKENDLYTLGLSLKGQDDVGDILFASLDKKEGRLEKGEQILGVEGAKAVTDLTSPLSGQIVAAHVEIEEDPDLLNQEDSTSNWVLQLTDVDEAEYLEIPEEMDPLSED